MTDTDRRFLALQRSIEELYDHQVRQRRMLADLLYNLDEENMPAVKAIIERYKAENGEAVAALRVTAEENYAAIESIAAVQTEQGESIASISQQADALGAEVVIAAEKANEANENVSNGAYIIARVNEDGSLVKIRADKLELSGYATFLSLKTAGATEIDGANLKTGTVIADGIALNANGQINFDKLGTLSFSDASGASGEIRLSENEFGRGEISVSADGTVALSGGSAAIILLDTGNGSTEVSVDANSFRMNGESGISGTFYFGNGSITVENGIVVSASDDSGDYEPIELTAPDVYLDAEYYYFNVSNPNNVGTVYYQTYWYDDYGNSWESEVYSDENSEVSGDITEYPDNGGYIGVRAWVEYDGHTSSTASSETAYA